MKDIVKSFSKEDLKTYYEYKKDLRELGETTQERWRKVKTLHESYEKKLEIKIPFDSFQTILDYEIIQRYFEE